MVSRLGFSFPSHSCNLYIPKFGDERICLCPSNTTCAHEATIIFRDRGLLQARITTQLLSIARQVCSHRCRKLGNGAHLCATTYLRVFVTRDQ